MNQLESNKDAHLGYVKLTLHFAQESDDTWTGECLELGTATYGDSLVEVRSELKMLIGEHVQLLEQCGERERFFGEYDIQPFA